MSIIKNKLATYLDDEEDSYISVANITGFTLIDYFSGYSTDNIYGFPTINGGLVPSLISMVGSSATGKTTLAIQMIGGALENWRRVSGKNDTGEFIFFDVEHNTPINRIKSILNWTDRDILNNLEYIDYTNSMLDIYNKIRTIAYEKEKNKNLLLHETEYRDIDSDSLTVYAPTFVLVDSVAVLTFDMEEFEMDKDGNVKHAENLFNNTDGAKEARGIISLIKKVKVYLKKYNIVLLMINHITNQIVMNAYDMPKKFLPFLKPGERLKGGDEMIFQSYSILNLEGKEKIDEKKPIYGDDIRGMLVKTTFIKNKGNIEGLPFTMVFDQKTGFRPELSDLEFLLEKNYGISGSPLSYKLDIYPSVSFTRKSVLETCKENLIFAMALKLTVKIYLYSVLTIGKDAPDLKSFAENVSEEKLKLFIYTYSELYPGYLHHDTNIDVEKMYEKLWMFNGSDLNIFSNVNVTKFDIENFKKDVEIIDGVSTEIEYANDNYKFVTPLEGVVVNCEDEKLSYTVPQED